MQGRSACIMSVGMHDCICIHYPPTKEFEDVQLPCRLAGPHVYPMELQMPCVCVSDQKSAAIPKLESRVGLEIFKVRDDVKKCILISYKKNILFSHVRHR